MPTIPNDYTLGRGKLFFDRFVKDTQTLTGEAYIGNTPAVSMTATVDTLDHYSSDEGQKVKDDSVRLQTDRKGSFQTDNLSVQVYEMLLGSTSFTRSTLGSTNDGDILTVTAPGLFYQLGKRVNLREGVRNIANVTVRDNTGAAATGTFNFTGQPTANQTATINGQVITFVAGAAVGPQVQIGANATLTAQALLAYVNAHPELQVVASGASTLITLTASVPGTAANAITLARSGSFPAVSGATLSGGTNGGVIPPGGNWEVDLAKARIYITPGGAITAAETIVVSYDIIAASMPVVVADDFEVEGAMRYISDNTVGSQKDIYWPWVKLTPNGDFALKGDTWLTATFDFEILVIPGGKSTYVTGG